MTSSRPAEAFAVRSAPRIFCIGRNYAKHIAELGNSLPGKECVVFMKPASSLVTPDEAITLPTGIGEIHHEAELVVEIGHGGRDIDAANAREHIGAIGLGLDLTLREVQTELKNTGEPWEKAKAFDFSAPLGPLVPLANDMNLEHMQFEFSVDGQIRQRGDTQHMLTSVANIVQVLSRHWRLLPGDLIYTGTPEGVGPIGPGMRLALSGPQLPSAEWITA